MKIPFEPNFKKGGGLITAVVQDIHSNEVIMLAYMDEEAYKKTLETGEAHYYSRSKQRLWHKGETSGHIQKIHSIRMDCDSDALLLKVEQIGGIACHEGYHSCFFRELKNGIVSYCFKQLKHPTLIYKK
ncbi:MAG: phosphoribosyl-AMP cyclohydrolase [Mailhella sp.]|nr:phosphoribosyl-AMP cyclohydrolase [Mailhella sp.]